jgi:hypothetical protein
MSNWHRAGIAVFNIECISTAMPILACFIIPSPCNLLTPHLTKGEIWSIINVWLVD